MNKPNIFPYNSITKGIEVQVKPIWLEEESKPENNIYFWAYIVRIRNLSKKSIQLISRYWRIVDLNGTSKEVKGEGVVGDQPIINSGNMYEYSSGTPLETPGGIMYGKYFMTKEGGNIFEVTIPTFSLDCPYQKVIIN